MLESVEVVVVFWSELDAMASRRPGPALSLSSQAGGDLLNCSLSGGKPGMRRFKIFRNTGIRANLIVVDWVA